jgi:demethylmenaquinone methyltransferase/2-methoxy-6-polyprenyl-1,4-benzoquinol methylase
VNGPDTGAELPPTDDLLARQIAYYRAHAPMYDDWWFRRDRYDLGDAFRLGWETEIAAVQAFLDDLGGLGEVLELAGGTGNWTAELVGRADGVTVVDAAPEAVAIARDKVAGPVEWLIADIFEFRPTRRYDTVFFSFWLSHVPEHRFDEFWGLVAECVRPGGRVVFVDNAHPSHGRHVVPHRRFRWDGDAVGGTRVEGIDSVTNLKTGISTRTAADGDTYDIVKVWWEPDALQARLGELGWEFHVALTDWAFLYGHGTRT